MTNKENTVDTTDRDDTLREIASTLGLLETLTAPIHEKETPINVAGLHLLVRDCRVRLEELITK